MKTILFKISLFSIIGIFHFTFVTAQLTLSIGSQDNTNCSGSDCEYDGPSILINEIMLAPLNGDGSIYGCSPASGGGCYGEWIELYNPDKCNAIDISCYFLGNNARDGQSASGPLNHYPGGFRIPANTIVPPQGFCVIRGQSAPAVPANLLVQNGGKTVEIVVNSSLASHVCLGGGFRLWFPNAGGWFAFYDRNGVPQDAVSWGNLSNSCTTCSPCNPGAAGPCTYTGTLTSYANIPANRKNYITSNDFALYNYTYRRVPDGGAWSSQATNNVTMGNCNAECVPPPVITCNGSATVTASGGTSPYSYIWNDSQSQMTQTATGLCAGTYCVTVTSSNNLTSSACVQVDSESLDILASTTTPAICEGGTLLFQATSDNDYSYIWTGPNSWTGAGGSVQLPNATPNMSGTYTVSVSNSVGCTGSATVVMNVNPQPTINLQANPTIICQGEQVSLTALTTVPFVWSHGLPLGNTHTVTPQPTTTYTVTATSSQGCTATASVTVTVNPSPSVTLTANPSSICSGEQTTLLAGGGDTYTWNQGLPPSTSHTVSPSTTTTYIVTGTSNNCSATAQVQVQVFPPVNVTILPEDPEICQGESLTLSSSTNASNPSYVWSSGQSTSSIQVNPQQSTTYSVTVTESGACSSSGSVEVLVYPKPNAEFSGLPLSGCVPLTVNFSEESNETNIISWNWSFGDAANSSNANPQHVYSQSGTYSVLLTVTNQFGCSESLEKPSYIEVYPQPVANFYTVPEIGKTYDPTITFYSDANSDFWLWDFGDGNSSNSPPPVMHTYPDIETSYTVMLVVSNSYGCVDTIHKEVLIINDLLVFPNVITPNGDGINDVLEIINADKYPNNRLVVYNRWGKVVFEQTNYQSNWDGRDLADGTYHYVFYYLDTYVTNSLTIIRN